MSEDNFILCYLIVSRLSLWWCLFNVLLVYVWVRVCVILFSCIYCIYVPQQSYATRCPTSKWRGVSRSSSVVVNTPVITCRNACTQPSGRRVIFTFLERACRVVHSISDLLTCDWLLGRQRVCDVTICLLFFVLSTLLPLVISHHHYYGIMLIICITQ